MTITELITYLKELVDEGHADAEIVKINPANVADEFIPEYDLYFSEDRNRLEFFS